MSTRKIIIVEGKTDKRRLEQILLEPVHILCTFGTLSDEKIEQFIESVEEDDVYILVDADKPGNEIRQQLKRELPNAKHLYTRRMYREVATTPISYLAKILHDAHFVIDESFLEEAPKEKGVSNKSAY